jgi:4-diphosphocytidyl-2-C-methyl-D-erythritol kinase
MTTDELVLRAPAKLNLFLHITGRRADGYHELQTLFQMLDYGDDLHLRRSAGSDITLQCNVPGLNNRNNLVFRAAELLQQTLQARGQQPAGAHIQLTKRIPEGGGLGGGSSDAAATLVGLNRLWHGGLASAELSDLGLRLGADVPVFVMGRTAWAEGIGERLTAVDLPTRYYIVLTPACHVATARIFSHEQLTRDSTAIKMHAFLAGQSQNDCESLVRKLYPQVDAALNWLNRFAPARMTGTGGSVFAAFADEAAAKNILQQLPVDSDEALANIGGFVARGVNLTDVARLQNMPEIAIPV